MSTYNKLNKFRFWAQKVLPLVYDESLSYYEVLCKVVDYLNKVIENQVDWSGAIEGLENDIDELRDEIDIVNDELEKVKSGDYVSLYLDSLKAWIDENLQELVARIVKQVWFGLTDTGYFVAYIPSSWDGITFDTIVDSTSELYGHLVLRY